MPSTRRTIIALRLAARVLGTPSAVCHDGAFWFPLGDGWALGITPESAGRFRLVARYGAVDLDTLWVLPGDWRRLAYLAQGLRDETEGMTHELRSY